MKWIWWVVTLAYMTVIYYLSQEPALTRSIPLDHGADKILHLVEFGILGALYYISLRLTFLEWQVRQCMWVSRVLGVFYATLDEIHQSWIPERTASVYDLAADTAGIVIFVYLIIRVPWVRKLSTERIDEK